MTINRKEIIKNILKLDIEPNENGLIYKYNHLINTLPISFWNKFTAKILTEAGDLLFDDTSILLENAATECAYHVAHGIVKSEEFKAICTPSIKNKEDILECLFAYASSFGWAKAEIITLVPEELMIAKAYDYYEADIQEIYKVEKPLAFILKGVCKGFMDYIYSKEKYPNGLGRFKCTQTKGIELGDFYSEFIVTPKG